MSDFSFPVIPSFQMPEIPEINIDTPAQHMWADDELWAIRSDVCDAGVVRRSGLDGLQGFCQRPGSHFDSAYQSA